MSPSYIQTLPDELVLSILHHLKQDNHLNLVPLSNSCRRFQRLSSDHMLWDGWVVMDTSSLLSSGMLRLPLSSSHKTYQVKAIAVVDADKTGLLALKDLLTRNDQDTPVAISIYTNHSSEYFSMLNDQCNAFKSISIMPSPASSLSMSLLHNRKNLNPDIPSPDHMSDYHPAVDPSSMCALFERMHSQLELFTYPLFPLHKLINTSTAFPNVHTLNVGLSTVAPDPETNNDDAGQAHLIDWSKVKRTFPNLQDLTLHPLSPTDMKTFWTTVRSLWAAPNLFPWLHSMTIQTDHSSSCLTYPMDSSHLSPTSLANHLGLNTTISPSSITKDEIIATLSRLKDLTRINTGSWDIVAVDQL